MRIAAAFLSLVVTTSALAEEKPECKALKVQITRPVEDAVLGPINTYERKLQAANNVKVTKTPVPRKGLRYIAQEADWRFVWAEPTGQEASIYFLQKAGNSWKIDSHGEGIMEEGDRQATIERMAKLEGGGPPLKLVNCYVDAQVRNY